MTRRVSTVSGSRPKKRFGQHFLSDPSILDRIVDAADVAAGDTSALMDRACLARSCVHACLDIVAFRIDHKGTVVAAPPDPGIAVVPCARGQAGDMEVVDCGA